jgi:hypothetical protein
MLIQNGHLKPTSKNTPSGGSNMATMIFMGSDAVNGMGPLPITKFPERYEPLAGMVQFAGDKGNTFKAFGGHYSRVFNCLGSDAGEQVLL